MAARTPPLRAGRSVWRTLARAATDLPIVRQSREVVKHIEYGAMRCNATHRCRSRTSRLQGRRQETDRRFNRITRPSGLKAGCRIAPRGQEKRSGNVPPGQPTMVERDDRGIDVTVLGERGKAWVSSLCGRGSASAAGKVRWATSSGAGRTRTRARGLGSQPRVMGSGAWSQCGGPHVGASDQGKLKIADSRRS